MFDEMFVSHIQPNKDYIQCSLYSESGQNLVTWVLKETAHEGKEVRLKGSDQTWTVKEVYKSTVKGSVLIQMRDQYKYARRTTDV
jgi:hypothetical protein